MISINNPGNLRPLPDPQCWHGQTGLYRQPTGEALCVFDSPINGIRALGLNLLAYWSAGYRTCRTISAHWAPSGDGNDPDAYARNVARWLGTGEDVPLPLDQLDALVAYGQAVSIEENGHSPAGAACWYSAADWRQGMQEALDHHFGQRRV
jgi:hypothetical protein